MWQEETNPVMDQDKRRILESAPGGSIIYCEVADGVQLKHQRWWVYRVDGQTIACAWADLAYEDAPEVCIVVEDVHRGSRIGDSGLDKIEEDLRVSYPKISAVVKTANPQGVRVVSWLYARGFRAPIGQTLETHISVYALVEPGLTLCKGIIELFNTRRPKHAVMC